ncbi:hypothetical protein LOTGIDRAFT_187174 [Lottia gigantea]|uniref:Dolichyl-phosphate beta-glucosyltransferase n=1 Tax=Lottia gigantea TaxID=225164 RepID=V4AP30_LOTGI|nr:hypothetical protein LOTGIDRAFT_187174 [Lottia gigantea]ESO98942.1 hypothetical protein LOTGIDRAFT_187174 [Lottia gigantea]
MVCELLLNLFWYCLIAGIAIIVVALIVIYVSSEPYPSLAFHTTENTFYTSTDCTRSEEFPSIKDAASIDLSVIVPAYNEEQRLPIMLDEALDFLKGKQKNYPRFSYEIIVVDDGSKDKTTQVALKYSEDYSSNKIRVLTLFKNHGKGGAVRKGMLVSRGRHLLFADADGASKFADYEKLETELDKIINNDLGVVCGSRAHLEEESKAQRSIFRTFLMYGFHFLVWFLCVRGVRDTQCGFKLLTRKSAEILFSNLHVNRWAFDVDLLFLAQYFKMPISEVAVTWHEIEGSKMVPVFSWIEMGIDILLIRIKYFIGAWKIREIKQE